ncbi:MAG TPA: hypothetical protein VNA44_05415 [Burkholderiaceae bacterium]|nr:hypothetical protein [Burkholderiaceae bacterium]
MLPIQQAAERIAGVEFKWLVADAWNVRRIRTPLFVIHDVGDEEVPISNGYAYTRASRTRVSPLTGLATAAFCEICRSLMRRQSSSPCVSPSPVNNER